MRRWSACVLLLSTAAYAVEPSSTATPLRGYTADHSTAEVGWETKFRAMPDQARLRENMRRLSARPHHVGSPYDKDNAEWLAAKFKSWGLDARIEIFGGLFPTTK